MKSRAGRVLGLLFIAHLFAYGIGLPILLLLGLPFIGWMIHGVLHFPVTVPELFRLVCLILGMTVFTTVVIWLADKWKGRW